MAATIEQIEALIREVVLRDAGVAGSVVFLDSNKKLAQNNSNLFWDASTLSFGVGTATPTGKMHVNQNVTAGAIPTLHLEQDDVSEELIRVTGQAAAGVLTQTLVLGSDVTTATKAAFIRVNVQDEGNAITDGNYYLQLFTIV